MSSVPGKIIKWCIRMTRPVISRMSLGASRRAQDIMGKLGAKVFSNKVNIETVEFEGFEAGFVTPHQDASDGAVLYLHGGGYTAGSLPYACGFGSMLAAITGRSVLCAAYRLAPENPFPAALEDALSAYLWLISQGYRAEDIAVAGESAGGGLSFALALLLKKRELPMPGRLITISPWADLEMRGRSYTENKKKDPSLSKSGLRWSAEAYAGYNLDDPLVSPIYGVYDNFPPTLIFAGSDELLLSDAQTLAARYEEAGSPCTLVVDDGMWHGYVLFGVPEARHAHDIINRFLKGEV